MTEFDGQWAVVTGGSKGIGRGIAEAYHRAGLNLVLAARDEADLATAARELSGGPGPGQVLTTVADTSTMAGIGSLFDFLAGRVPSLNVFVANAGTQRLNDFLAVTEDDWDTINSLNFKGTFFCCQNAARRMLAEEDNPNRSIIVVSSNRASTIRPESLAYSMTKAGLIRFVRGAASELAPHGVRVNALSPGVTATPLSLQGHHAHAYERAAKRVPMGRVGSPADVGAGALYLASPASAFVTGTDLVIDGGEALW